MRTACYARFSSDLQRDTSLEDQIRSCREYADQHQWTWQDAQVFTDAAVSGASLDGRAGLQALLAAACQRPRPFDVLLVDDSSRVARDLADALRVLQRLKFAGVRVVYISQGIDSASEQAETLITVHGLVDGLYLREMAQKIRRGLVGQMERGYSTGGVKFGYRVVPVEDPTGARDVTGRPALLGNRVEVEPTEAPIVVRIFTWYAEGLGVPSIVQRLHADRARGPQGHTWKAGAVRRLLHNERFTGKQIYGQVRYDRNPGTRQVVARRVPRADWRVLERPELRIISDELWRAVQVRAASVAAAARTQAGSTRMRGRNAFLYSRHLFSGFLTCGACGGAITIVSGGWGSPRYGCQRHAKGDACPVKLTIRAKVADAVLLEGLQAELVKPETVTYLTARVSAALNAVIDRRPQARAALEQQRVDVTAKVRRIIAAIESGGDAPALLAALDARQAELRTLAVQLDAMDEAPLRARLAVLPTWVRQQVTETAALLAETPERAKTEFQRLGVRFTLHAVHTDRGRAHFAAEGAGAFETLTAGQFVPLLPARDRSLHPPDGRRTFTVSLPACQPYVRKTG